MAYDSAATRERILKAATAEFAEHGVAGARVDRVAARAKANKRAIYEYFGDKKALFTAVIEQLMTEVAEAVPPDGGDPAAYAERLYEYNRAHPETLRLLMWEALEAGDEPVPNERERAAHYQDKAAALAAADPVVEPRAFALYVLALVSWPLAMPQLHRMLMGEDASPDDLRPALRAAVTALTSGGQGRGPRSEGASADGQ
ncbi:TetR family transcriptional regulator [Actinomadura gamaensis]|uniref:TetR family transcriptional regulator n=1 Tax=Actinomadura gamaensis TaxID=1763541 RepID=A0ABV9UAS5_9ACTN